MPLSAPQPRKHIHTRTYDCKGFLREDGLWDIEGNMVDTKTYDFENDWRGPMPTGSPVHDMWMRLTIDHDFVVQNVEVQMDSTPYQICPQILPNFQHLVGLQIGRGWNHKVKQLLSGVAGCTHLVELLGPMATVAFQTIRAYQNKLKREGTEPEEQQVIREEQAKSRPGMLNSCYAWSTKGEVVKRWAPDFYTGE